jgi:hypothetical protein
MDEQDGDDDRGVKPTLKRKYIRPAVLTEKLFEAMAGCGKNDPASFTCERVPRDGS